MKSIDIKRIYEPAEVSDGCRVLVDRLWPRGVKKEAAQLNKWCKEIAPSSGLRKWFHAGEGSFEEFEDRYKEELKDKPEMLDSLRKMAQNSKVTLLYGARNETQNHAQVLKQVLEKIKIN